MLGLLGLTVLAADFLGAPWAFAPDKAAARLIRWFEPAPGALRRPTEWRPSRRAGLGARATWRGIGQAAPADLLCKAPGRPPAGFTSVGFGVVRITE